MPQRYRTTASVVFVAVMAVVAATACDAPAQSARKSAYDSIDTTRLDSVLESLGMGELQDQLDRETAAAGGGGIDGMERTARRRIGAAKAARDAKTRNARLDEAVALLNKAIALRKAEVAKAAKELDRATGTLNLWKAELALAVADALTRGKPYADKVFYLQASRSDRNALADATASAAALVRRLRIDMEEMIEEWRSEMPIWIVIANQATGLKVETKYRAAQIRLYHGMAAKNAKDPDDAQVAEGDLRAARNSGEEFANARGDPYGVRSQARLLVARALRELGEHTGAAQMLTKFLTGRPSADLVIDAHFENVRNLIEHGRTLARQNKNGDEIYDRVPAAIKTFQAKAMAAAKTDPKAERRVDLLATLAENYLYENRATTERKRNAAKADTYDAKAQEALIGFLDKYADQPGVRDSFYEIIYNKYSDRKDHAKLGSIVLMAIASHEYGVAEQQDRDKVDNAAALKKTVDLLDVILKRADAVTRQRVRPDALWQYAWVHNMKRENFESATKFSQLAREFPDHPLAFPAAENARNTIDTYYKQAERKAENLRRKYIEIFEVYCGGEKWRDKPDVLPWNFQLAEQYEFFCDDKARPAADKAIAKASNAAREAREMRARANEATNAKIKAQDAAQADLLEAAAQAAQAQADEVRNAAIADCIRVAATYEKVPDSETGRMAHMQARQRALQYRTHALILLPKGDEAKEIRIKGAGMILARQQLAYSDDVLQRLKKVADPEAKKHLKNWGGDARFSTAELLLRYGNGQSDSVKAMGILDEIREKWSDTTAFSRSEDLRIRQLVKGGQVDKAITALFKFLDLYPERGEALLRMVITEIQGEIELLEGHTKSDLVKRYNKLVADYVKLADKLYERVKGKPLSDPQCYAITQTYAHSLMKAGKHAEALVLFLKCQAQDEAGTKQKQAAVDASLAPLRKALGEAGTYKAVSACIEKLKTFMAERKLDAKTTRDLANSKADVERQMRILKATKEDAKVFKMRLENVKEAVTNWINEVMSLVKGRAEVSALNILGIARSNEGLAELTKDSDKAKEHYVIAIKGFRELAGTNFNMNVRHEARMKWLGLLGYCRCLLASNDSRETAKAVLLLIKIARRDDTMPGGSLPMGGYGARFMKLESKAKDR